LFFTITQIPNTIYLLYIVDTVQHRPDSSGWMFGLAIARLFAEYIAKNGRHLEDAIHKRIAGPDVTTEQ